MSHDEDRASILRIVKERVRQSEDEQLIQMISDAVGECRYRDLRDLISQMEQDRGWTETIKYLSNAEKYQYTLPIGAGPNKTQVENLKYREAIFTLLDCSGFEPIPIEVKDIFMLLENEASLIDASSMFQTRCESLAIKQIKSGDTLFFDLSFGNLSFSKDFLELLEQSQNQELTNLILYRDKDTISILPLWYCEKGRQALSEQGIQGTKIDSNTFDIVMSVIQQNIETTESLEASTRDQSVIPPSNHTYSLCLTSMISHDIKPLISMASKHSHLLLKSKLETSLDSYNHQPTSSNFRNILSSVNALVRVRVSDSIMFLERLCHSKDSRIATTAITALGNFYNESAASALVDLLCVTKNGEVQNTTTRAIKNISKRCLEAKYVVKQAQESASCKNIGQLKRLYKELWKEKDDYYL